VRFGYLLLLIVVAAIAAFIAARRHAQAFVVKGEKLHSRSVYSGALVAIATAIPALILAALWFSFAPAVIHAIVAGGLPADVLGRSPADQTLIMAAVATLAENIPRLSGLDIEALRGGGAAATTLLQERGISLAAPPESYVIDAAISLYRLTVASRIVIAILCAALAAGGFFYAWRRLEPNLRARNLVEQIMLIGLIAASTVAILTTIGIVASVLFETLHFFSMVSPLDFFFGTVWDPRFSAAGSDAQGQFGLIPVLWGTIFISLMAMLVAVPVGLFAAVYMSEYASSRMRGFAKPVLEILAGIPTIVYGFFALVTFGPFLRDVGGTVGLNISANSVLTAGVVMGIMIIPFVSSLSDDIISAVPNAMREGSYGLGATQSETIKRVILPSALPGIVGAVLLAVSRAIGETMIVVLAAGIAANLTLNPFEPVTTITVKIVSQLTGDLEFNSPQTLVAFALGLTLFVITLGLNIVALYIVRRYREQYE
jgi:phosphate transport system permease protein